MLCKGMKWNHLPVSGGIYDQHPKLLDDFQIIMKAEADAEARKAAERERTMQQKAAAPR